MEQITSSQNSIIKEIKSLKTKKYRDEKSLFFIEGIRFTEEAIKENAEITKILISESFNKLNGGEAILKAIINSNYQVFLLTDKLFKEISDTENPQGILAVIKQKKSLLDFKQKQNNFYIILESIQDPGNLGTIIRTADAAGVTGVILSKGCVDLYNPKVLRSTMGSIFHIPTYTGAEMSEVLCKFKENGVKIIATHLDGPEDLFEIKQIENIAVIIGNEANGITQEAVSFADKLVRIPMPGRAESLNASVAAALIMYEIVRKRYNKLV